MSNHARDLEFPGRLDVEGRVETHLEVAFDVFVEYTQVEDRRRKRVREYNDTICRIREGLYLEQADLVQTAREQVDYMAVVGRTLWQPLIELEGAQHEQKMRSRNLRDVPSKRV